MAPPERLECRLDNFLFFGLRPFTVRHLWCKRHEHLEDAASMRRQFRQRHCRDGIYRPLHVPWILRHDFVLLLHQRQHHVDERRRVEAVRQADLQADAYRGGRWNAARQDFVAALEIDPADGPSRTFLNRCEYYAAMPPLGDWDDVRHAQQIGQPVRCSQVRTSTGIRRGGCPRTRPRRSVPCHTRYRRMSPSQTPRVRRV
jgi:hypothetical protein